MVNSSISCRRGRHPPRSFNSLSEQFCRFHLCPSVASSSAGQKPVVCGTIEQSALREMLRQKFGIGGRRFWIPLLHPLPDYGVELLNALAKQRSARARKSVV